MAKKLIFYLLFKQNIVLVFLLYFFIRLIFLTNIPIFNDESIYIDWGWRQVNLPNNRFYSLFYGNQPFLMWIFGKSQSIFSDPLFAGRVISVLTGFLSLVGIYALSKKLFNRAVAVQASILYIITPLFSFFDRQALMESSISSISIWSCYFSLKLFQKQRPIHAVLLGIILGVGFSIKSTTIIFISVYLLFSLYFLIIQRRKQIFTLTLITALFFLIVNNDLLRQPLFWETFPLIANTRSLNADEILGFPLDHWVNIFIDSLELGFWHITPLIFIYGILGFILLSLKEKGVKIYISIWFIFSFLILILVARTISPRYIAPFLPILLIFSSYFLFTIWKNYKKTTTILFIISVVPPVWLTVFQVIVPLDYFYLMNQVTQFSQKNEYVSDWQSGYSIREVCNYINNKAKEKKLYIAVRNDSGNPENAIFACFNKSSKVKVTYFDAGNLNKDINGSNCIRDYMTNDIPDYYVSRDNQLGGLDLFLTEESRFYKPEGKSYVGIYRIRSECKGKIS